jgi:hypothetical protein
VPKEREMEIEQNEDECIHLIFPPSSCRLCNPKIEEEVIWIGESESD